MGPAVAIHLKEVPAPYREFSYRQQVKFGRNLRTT